MRKSEKIRANKALALMLVLILAFTCFGVPTFAEEKKAALETKLENGLADKTKATCEKQLTTFFRGDVTEDGAVNTGDAVMILRYSVGSIAMNERQLTLGDANGDGNINTGDAVKVLRITVGIDDAEEIELETDAMHSVTYFSGVPTDEETIEVPQSDTAEEGKVYKVSTFVPTRNEYTFTGWQSNMNNLIFAAGANVMMPSYDLTLIALWESGSIAPTPTPTTGPTTEPTTDPTTEPTVPPTAPPLPTGNPDGYTVTITFFDALNELEVDGTATVIASGNITLDANNVSLPEGYGILETALLMVHSDIEYELKVYPYTDWNYQGNLKTFRVIKTVDGLDNIRNDMEANYLLENDIDMLEYTDNNSNFYCLGWPQNLSTQEKIPFTGIFDGNEHTISNFTCCWLTSNNAVYVNVGLFSKNRGTIMNLNIETTEGTPNDHSTAFGVFGCKNVGIVTGDNYGRIINVHTSGNFGASDFMIAEGGSVSGGATGGIAGCNQGIIKQCSVVGFGEGHLCAGGIVGKNLSYAIVSESFFAGSINNNMTDDELVEYESRYIGGIAGATLNSTVQDCYVILADVLTGEIGVGGFYGATFGGDTILCCYLVNHTNMYAHSGYYCDYVVGYPVAVPANNYLYAIGGENPYTALPDGFDSNIWTLEGMSCLDGYPDLVKNRRPEFDVTYG